MRVLQKQKDFRSKPIKTMVTLGESTTWGYSVSEKSKCWVNRLGESLSMFQGSEIKVINKGIGSNLLTRKSKAFEHSRGEAGLNRVEEDVIKHNPDLVILSYGLNDSRGGTLIREFKEEYQKLIDIIKEKTNAVIILVNTYYMHECLYSENCEHWHESDYSVTEMFNVAIKHLAIENDLIYADVYSAEKGVDWIIDEDHCHPNDLGHYMIANRVFEAIARNCSFVANTMPKETLISEFFDKYGNGPDID